MDNIDTYDDDQFGFKYINTYDDFATKIVELHRYIEEKCGQSCNIEYLFSKNVDGEDEDFTINWRRSNGWNTAYLKRARAGALGEEVNFLYMIGEHFTWDKDNILKIIKSRIDKEKKDEDDDLYEKLGWGPEDIAEHDAAAGIAYSIKHMFGLIAADAPLSAAEKAVMDQELSRLNDQHNNKANELGAAKATAKAKREKHEQAKAAAEQAKLLLDNANSHVSRLDADLKEIETQIKELENKLKGGKKKSKKRKSRKIKSKKKRRPTKRRKSSKQRK